MSIGAPSFLYPNNLDGNLKEIYVFIAVFTLAMVAAIFPTVRERLSTAKIYLGVLPDGLAAIFPTV